MFVKLVVIEGRGRCELITCATAGFGWRGKNKVFRIAAVKAATRVFKYDKSARMMLLEFLRLHNYVPVVYIVS